MPRSSAFACTTRPPMYTSFAFGVGSSACTLKELIRSVAQTYRRCDSGSYELGGQFAPPIVPGFMAIGSVQNGVKILPSLITLTPLGTMLEPSGGMSIDCGTIASPTGNGCVAEVACRGSCITGFSSMPTSGWAVSRARVYAPHALAH